MADMDIEAIRAKLAGSMANLQAAGSQSSTAAPPPTEAIGPLGGAWTEGTRLGAVGPQKEVGTWLQETWDKVQGVPTEEGGVLGVAGQEKDGGPPDRTSKLRELQKMDITECKDWGDICEASALHCAFSLIFMAHQQAIAFDPSGKLTIGVAGQKATMSPEQAKFAVLLRALNLAQYLARDARNLGFGRYGENKVEGRKNTSQLTRSLAGQALTNATKLKEHVNEVMSDVYSHMA